MSDRPTPVIVHLSGHLRGTMRRLAGDSLRIGTAFSDPIRVMPHELPPGEAETVPGGHLGTLEWRDGTYELVPVPGAEMWVNGAIVERKMLGSSDVLEIGAGGPVLRFRLYPPGVRPFKSVSEIFSDCRDCVHHGGPGTLRRAGILMAGAPRELLTQTSPRFRVLLADPRGADRGDRGAGIPQRAPRATSRRRARAHGRAVESARPSRDPFVLGRGLRTSAPGARRAAPPSSRG